MRYVAERELLRDPLLSIPEIRSAIDEYGLVVEAIGGASMRMRSVTGLNDRQYLNKFRIIPDNSYEYGYYVWLTDQVNEIPYPETVYHVTGVQAAKSIIEGKPILPSNSHILNEIKTHKSIAIYLCQMFFLTLNIDSVHLKDFVYSGSQVDAGQIRLSLNLADRSIDDYEQELVALFLEKNQNGLGFRLSSRLEATIKSLQAGKKPFEEPELKDQVDSFLVDLYRLTHIREGWLELVRDTLYGVRPIDYFDLEESMLMMLSLAEYKLKMLGNDPIDMMPAVLRISTKRLLNDLQSDGLNCILVDPLRQVHSILPTLNITPECVSDIYVPPSYQLDVRNSGIKVQTLDDIPPTDWLGEKDWRNVVNPDMWNPICAIRYKPNSQPFSWIDAARRGLIAPLHSIYSARSVPMGVLLSVFGASGFEFTKTELYKQHPIWFREALTMQYPHIMGVF